MKLSEISIKRPVFATMMIGALLVIGWFSYMGLSVNMFPDVDFPLVVVQTAYPGASAETIETEVSKKIEEVVNEISGIKNLTSNSIEGVSLVIVEFELDEDGALAAQDVREKIAGIINELPEDIEDPVVTQFEIGGEPIMSLILAGERPLKEITDIAEDKIKTRLETINGIGSVELVGGFEREIQVGLNPETMESLQLTITDVQNAISAANMEIPGGRVDEASQEFLVRIKGRLESVDDFNNIIVKNRKGTPIYLSDIAIVSDTIVDQRSLSRFNGNTTVALNVVKQSGSNVVELAENVKKEIKRLQDELPPDVRIQIVDDQSVFINDSIHELIFNISIGTLLAVIIIFLFLLDIKPTIITGLSIPISIIATFTLMKLLGFTINFMTLLGLSLAVGILIDDAIVVVENIYRHLSMGKNPFRAAIDGTNEIGLAVMATTFTIMVVFLPVAFMEDIVGRFFYQFGVTVAFSVLVSLFVAFSLTPMLSSRMLKKTLSANVDDIISEKSSITKPIFKVLGYWNRMFDALLPSYKKLLAASLRHRWVVIIVSIMIFFSSLYLAQFVGQEWMSQPDQGKLYLTIETPPGTSLNETSRRVGQVEGILSQLPEVVDKFVTIGSGNSTVQEASLLVNLTSAEEREIHAKNLADSVRILISTVPGIKSSIAIQPSEGGSSKPIEMSVRGDDREVLRTYALNIQKMIQDIPGTIDVDNSMAEGKPEIQINVDRKKADDLGMSLSMIPMTLRNLVEGDVVTKFKDGDDEVDVRVKLQEKYRSSTNDLERILVESNKEVDGLDKFLVPIGRYASIEKQSTIGEYNRFNRQNEIRINSNVLTGYFSGTISNEILAKVDSLDLPPGYSVSPVGEEQMRSESNANILNALMLAVIFIYILLASQYESFFDPLSIMISLPLSLIGAILGLLVFNSSFSIFSMIGIVMLMGLVTKNAILLIDFVKQQREKGVSKFEAILIAGPVRLRPILMTTFATVFGMLPIALELGPGAEMRSPMARAAIGGIISSTLLTLVVVPVVYSIIDDIVEYLKRLFKVKAYDSEGNLLDEQFDSPN